MAGISKPVPSLTGGLLARKGQARPAMRRPQPGEPGDDLGWNDMGTGAAPMVPPVLLQRRELARELAAAPELSPEELGRIGSALSRPAGRSAFTLRLDADRHSSLRLACALDKRSAQAIVTEALDRWLEKRPEVEALRRQLHAASQTDLENPK